MSPQTSRRETLSKIVADVLRQSLHDGVYICGDRLVELTIAHEMNVSQNTARDALSILEHEGWVVRRARHGVFVRSFTPDAVTELFMLRATLECLALRWRIEYLSTRYDGLKHDLETARAWVNIKNVQGARQILFSLHTTIAQITDKPQTVSILFRLHNQTRLLQNMRRIQPHPTEMTSLLTLYDVLLTHIHNRNLAEAQIQLEDLIMRDGESLLEALNEGLVV